MVSLHNKRNLDLFAIFSFLYISLSYLIVLCFSFFLVLKCKLLQGFLFTWRNFFVGPSFVSILLDNVNLYWKIPLYLKIITKLCYIMIFPLSFPIQEANRTTASAAITRNTVEQFLLQPRRFRFFLMNFEVK